MSGKDLILKGESFIKDLQEFISGVPQESDIFDSLESTISTVQSLNNELKSLEPKKKYVGSGNFNLSGRYDLRPEAALPIVIFGRKFNLTIDNTTIENQVIEILNICGIDNEDLTYLSVELDIIKDILRIDFVYQTDLVLKDGQDISAELPALYSFGYTQFNKIYIRGNKTFIDPEVYNWPLLGFCIPYGLDKNNQHDIMMNVIEAPKDFGELADMRALDKLPQAEIEIFVNKFKAKKWTRIITPTVKWWFRNGQYIQFK